MSRKHHHGDEKMSDKASVYSTGDRRQSRPHALPFAEDVNYWKTGKSSPDTLVSKAVEIIRKLGGTNIAEAFGSYDGRAAFIVQFNFGEERFRIAWPCLPQRKADERAARIQAATFLFYDVKAKALSAAILGPRAVFIGSLLLPSGKTVTESALPAIAEHMQIAGYLK